MKTSVLLAVFALVGCGVAAKSTVKDTLPSAKPTEKIFSGSGLLKAKGSRGGDLPLWWLDNGESKIALDLAALPQFDPYQLRDKRVDVRGTLVKKKTVMNGEIEIFQVKEIKERVDEMCLAYFTGANLNLFDKTCYEGATSGCSNPFVYDNLQSCEEAKKLP